MFDVEGDDDVLIIGCNTGVDIEVVHAGSDVHLTRDDETTYDVTLTEWSVAVCQFADIVQGFYAASSPKTPEDSADRAGFVKLIREWARRRGVATNGAALSSPFPYQFPLVDLGEAAGPSLPTRIVQWFSKRNSNRGALRRSVATRNRHGVKTVLPD
jgi:hypothetical protein